MKKDCLYPFRVLHGYFHEWRLNRIEKRKLRKKYKTIIHDHFSKEPNSVILALTPHHSNLGDHAIAYAEINWLKDMGISHIEITGIELDMLNKCGLLKIMNGYPIIINGGGNMGTLWIGVEYLMRNIVKHNPRSTILIMPNTIYYEDSQFGMKEFAASKSIYNAHKSLHIYGRERKSYEVMKSAYHNVKLVPDVVLSLNETSPSLKRNGCLLCLRGDKERTLTPEIKKELIEKVEGAFGSNYRYLDTHANGDVSKDERSKALEKKFLEFKSSEIVITDRLHGMIFSAITGTPCIVINSKSPKIKGCYEWIKHLEYIWFADDISEINEVFRTIPKRQFEYNNEHIMPYYEEIKCDITKVIKDN